jgi:hypothetical protein
MLELSASAPQLAVQFEGWKIHRELRGDTIIDGLVFIVFDGTGSAVEGSGRYDAGIISRRKD